MGAKYFLLEDLLYQVLGKLFYRLKEAYTSAVKRPVLIMLVIGSFRTVGHLSVAQEGSLYVTLTR